jgi:hypothetical protein
MQDTVSKDIGGRFPGMVIGPPRTKADTAFVTASRVENNGGVEGSARPASSTGSSDKVGLLHYRLALGYIGAKLHGVRQAAWSQIRIQTSERFGSR